MNCISPGTHLSDEKVKSLCWLRCENNICTLHDGFVDFLKILFSFTLKFEIEIILISVEATKVLWYASLSFQFYLFLLNSKAS